MNKEKYIKELCKELNCDNEYARKISDSLEENFIIGKNNKENIINHLIEELKIGLEEADNIYNVSSSIIVKEIKNKIIHPFKNLDN